MILVIDPGPVKSAYLLWTGETCQDAGIVENEALRAILFAESYTEAAIEMVACYGMAVGKEVFETCVWIGRFLECIDDAKGVDRNLTKETFARRIYRKDVKMHLCHSMRARDANIRQAILDRFGGKEMAIGKKANPGQLYAIKSHLWSCLAIALYCQDTK